MQRAFELLKSYPGLGDFLAYQYVTDINYSEITDFSEAGFCRSRSRSTGRYPKIFVERGGLNEPETMSS